eukprot:RCo008003
MAEVVPAQQSKLQLAPATPVDPYSEGYCTVHKRMRMMKHLVRTADGQYQCNPSPRHRCSPKNPDLYETCSVHNKLRLKLSLVQDPSGKFRCIHLDPCNKSEVGRNLAIAARRRQKKANKRKAASSAAAGEKPAESVEPQGASESGAGPAKKRKVKRTAAAKEGEQQES